MELEKAITVLTNMMAAERGEGLTRRIDALKLGIEALKYVEDVRGITTPYLARLLPGETED